MRLLGGLRGSLVRPVLWAALACSGLAAGQTKAPTTNNAVAPSSPGQITWASLSGPQKRDLQPLQKDWASLTTDRQQKWLEVAARMPIMTDDERERVRERMFEWARLSPSQRGQARLQFQEVRQWPTEDRQARWEAYLALSDDERTALVGQAQRGSALLRLLDEARHIRRRRGGEARGHERDRHLHNFRRLAARQAAQAAFP